MAYPGRQNIYEATIRRMVQQALEDQEQEFREQHEKNTDQELLMYLRSCAMRLHHTPWPGENPGHGGSDPRCCMYEAPFLSAKAGHWVKA